MFGARIRNWMETHFVRHRKKRSKDAKAKDPPPVEPAKAQSSPAICTPLANTSHASGHQSLSTSALCHSNPATSSSTQPTKRVTLVSPTLSCKYSYTEESTGLQLCASGCGINTNKTTVVALQAHPGDLLCMLPLITITTNLVLVIAHISPPLSLHTRLDTAQMLLRHMNPPLVIKINVGILWDSFLI
jgi:hypothetical protein